MLSHRCKTFLSGDKALVQCCKALLSVNKGVLYGCTAFLSDDNRLSQGYKKAVGGYAGFPEESLAEAAKILT